jgi:hypothetical protein
MLRVVSTCPMKRRLQHLLSIGPFSVQYVFKKHAIVRVSRNAHGRKDHGYRPIRRLSASGQTSARDEFPFALSAYNNNSSGAILPNLRTLKAGRLLLFISGKQWQIYRQPHPDKAFPCF